MKARNSKIDCLRVLGILLIILAHCDAPKFINDLRSFDVILLVYLSAYVAPFERIKDKHNYYLYCRKRVQRLLNPTYVFIITYSVVLFFLYCLVGRLDLFPPKQWINSFLMCEDSIGYVWIVKVYFINALLGPICNKIISRFKNNVSFILFISIEIIVYTCVKGLYINYISESYIGWIFIDQWVMCCMAYLIVMQDCIWAKVNEKWKKYGYIIWLLVFIATCVINKNRFIFSPSTGKRPVNLHYLSFGMTVTLLLIRFIPAKKNSFIEYISKNSFTLYLIHPIFILIFRIVKNKMNFSLFYLFEWVCVFSLSVLTLWTVQKAKRFLIEKRDISE